MLHILFIVGAVNAVLTIVKTVLDKYAATSKADSIVGSAIKGLSMVTGFLTANTTQPAALPAPKSS